MSKPWKPRKPTVALKPSRIRREPLRLGGDPGQERKAQLSASEREMRGGVLGVLLFAAALAVVIVGFSAATIFRDDPEAAARARQFGQCYNATGPNCVLDGDTIRVGGEKVEIAGIEAPQIQGARCSGERTRGIEAAVRLVDLLNSGRVTVSGTFRDRSGREVRKVQVNGEDVGEAMIAAGIAGEDGNEPADWC